MSTPRRPNLVFLMADHQRADSLGMIQAGTEVTPNLNRLAGQGSVFSRAYSTCPLCVPARTALATGKYPTRTGVVLNDWRGVSANDHVPLHQVLHEAGYEVAHIGVDHIRVKPGLRERVPFRVWNGNAEHAAHLASVGIDATQEDLTAFRKPVLERQGTERREALYSNTRAEVWPHAAEHFKDAYWCRAAAGFVRRDHDGPFALFLYLWAPHPPLRVPEPYASLFDPAALELPTNVGEPGRGEPPNRRKGVAAQLAEGLSMADWRRVWAAHLGLVRLADDGIGRVLDTLADCGHADNTLTVFTADHGDHLGQHSMYQKMEMYEPALNIPLAIAGPGVKQQAIDQPVSHLNLMPTVLDFLGLDVPTDLDAVSLAPALLGREPVAECPVFAQYSGNPVLGDTRRAIVLGHHKYIHDPAAPSELYDLQADPLEMDNLAENAAFRTILTELHAQCEAWGREHGDPVFA